MKLGSVQIPPGLARGAGPSTGPIFRSQSPDLIMQEHAARATACELARAVARAAARLAAPARKGCRAGKPVQPREISFTAARRAAITTTRRDDTLRELAKRRVVTGRDR